MGGTTEMLVVGLMSGTSLDGIDAALVQFDGELASLKWRVAAFESVELTVGQRTQIHDAMHGNAEQLCQLHADIGEWFAAATLKVCQSAGVNPEQVDLVGSHGQTIWHKPPGQGKRGSTLQLGCPATIAERTGIPVVSDFRTRDMAAMGHGAPLVPWADRWLFSSDRTRVLLNIGGIANLTWLPPRGSKATLLAFDTGPGNALMNAAVEWASAGAEAFDRDGKRAARGAVDEELLNELLEHAYFAEEPPKSTGRELFGKPFVEDLIARHGRLRVDPNQLVSTLTELTARTVASAIQRWVLPRGVDEVVVTGGGGRNPELVRRLRQALGSVPVLTGDTLGLDPDAKEAVAFAALAWAHVNSIPGNIPEATGAQGPRVLGSFTPGTNRGRVILEPYGK
jgi:anhydro-N-acetylmuramic acid kinase